MQVDNMIAILSSIVSTETFIFVKGIVLRLN